MEVRELGLSGLRVSRLSLGAMTFGDQMPPISNVESRAAQTMLERALEGGINFLDTADAYSRGQSEAILAPFLARNRDNVVVATKLGFGGAQDRPLSRENVTASVELSLSRLGIETIDVLYLHRPDRSTPIDETFDALDELVSRGLVRTLGVSNWSAGETGYTVGRQRALGKADLTSVQVYWSLVGRDVEQEIVPTCSRLGVGVVVWSPLAAGYLTGRVDGRRSALDFPPVDAQQGPRILSALRTVAEEVGATPAQVAIAWLLRQDEVTSVILGASSLSQLDENLAAADLPLDDAHMDALSEASAIGLSYPRWWEGAMGVS